MTDPEIAAALRKLIATTPTPVTVWGVRYTQQIEDIPAGHIDWLDSEGDAREWLADAERDGYPAELVRVTGRVHVEG